MDREFYNSFLLIAEEKSIAKAAERLFISRSALNRQLLQAENEFGLPLFKRTANALELTYAGQVFQEMCKSVEASHMKAKVMLDDLANYVRGKITFGASSSVCTELLKQVFPDFHSTFPGITIEPHQADSGYLVNLLQNGKLDLAVISENDANPLIETQILSRSEVFLCVPKNHPMADRAARDKSGVYRQCDLNWFKDDSFCLQGAHSPLFSYISDAFRRAGYTPNIAIEGSVRSISEEMVRQGIALAFLADFYPHRKIDYVKFGLDPRIYYTLSIAYPKGYTPNRAESYFIELIRKYYSNLSFKRFSTKNP